MDAWLAAVLVLLAAGGWLWRRRARRAAWRRAAGELQASLERDGWQARPAGPRTVEIVQRDELLAAVDLDRLERALTRAPADQRRRVLRTVAAAAGQRPAALPGPYALKRHGVLTVPRLASEGLLVVTAALAPVTGDPLAGEGPRVVYQLLGEPGLTLVAEHHLAAAGIDQRDLHGVALAVLRQRSDLAGAVAAARAGELVSIASEDGCGGSRLLLVAEHLSAGEQLFAAAPEPALLVVAGAREWLEAALAALEPPSEPLPPTVLRLTAAGVSG